MTKQKKILYFNGPTLKGLMEGNTNAYKLTAYLMYESASKSGFHDIKTTNYELSKIADINVSLIPALINELVLKKVITATWGSSRTIKIIDYGPEINAIKVVSDEVINIGL